MGELTLDEKKRIYSLFKKIETNDEAVKLKNNILIIDGLNTYLRAFSVVPTLNDNGVHTGGISGFLKSIGYAIRLINPTKCIVVFDGSGGSYRRRKIYPDYKNKRKTDIRLNRVVFDDTSSESEKEAMTRQLVRISHYLDCLPVNTVCVDNVEADDVIAYLAQQTYKNDNVHIMSSDKDFLQLTSEKIKIYSPTKKKIYGIDDVSFEYGIHPTNFVLFRSLDGDVSDNIPGITGCGLKTIKKIFPFLIENKKYTIDDLIIAADKSKGKYKVCQTIIDNKKTIERNYEIMQLSETFISTIVQLNINDLVANKKRLNEIEFINLMKDDLLWNAIPAYPIWLKECFSTLDGCSIL